MISPIVQSTLVILIPFLLIGSVRSSPKPPRPPGLCTRPIFSAIHPKDDDRIVGGLEAQPGQFPYQVSLQMKFSSSSSHYCGGSYISPNYVATAAHCVKGREAANILVVGGAIEFDDTVVTSKVAQIITHPEYDPKTVNNDIALLKLESPVEFSDNVGAVPALTSFTETREGAKCIVSGWGTTSEGGSLPDKLRFVEVDALDDTKCRDQYGESEIADSMICAGVDEGGKDSCQGDSGGPMVCDGKLVGIVSWGYGCARPSYSGVYTQVSYFTDWIKEVTCGLKKVQ